MQENDHGKQPTASKMPPWGWGTEAEVIRLAARLNRLLMEARLLREIQELGVPAIAPEPEPSPRPEKPRN